MCPNCRPTADFRVSELTYCVGRIDISELSQRQRKALKEFAADPSDTTLQPLSVALGGHPAWGMLQPCISEIRVFGWLKAVLRTAEPSRVATFNAALGAIKGGHHE